MAKPFQSAIDKLTRDLVKIAQEATAKRVRTIRQEVRSKIIKPKPKRITAKRSGAVAASMEPIIEASIQSPEADPRLHLIAARAAVLEPVDVDAISPGPGVRAPNLDPLEQRELCDIHGYVGRVAFQRDQHTLCMFELPDIEPSVVEDIVPHVKAAPVLRWRRRSRPRSRSVMVKRITRFVLAEGEAELDADLVMPPRPVVRDDCRACPTCQAHVDDGGHDEGTLSCGHDIKLAVNRCRPCIRVGCRQHNYLDVSEVGSIKFNFPELEPDELVHGCALDLAEAGPRQLEQIGLILNVTRERVRQIEVRGLHALKGGVAEHRIDYDPDVGPKRVWHDADEREISPSLQDRLARRHVK